VEMRRCLGRRENLTLNNFHALCADVSGRDVEPNRTPEAPAEAVAAKPSLKGDRIIIHEGQCLREDRRLALAIALADTGMLLVMADTNQRVYQSCGVPILDLELIPIRLTRNLRNTKRVHDAASNHYEGHTIIADGPDGTEVEWFSAPAQDALIPLAID